MKIISTFDENQKHIASYTYKTFKKMTELEVNQIRQLEETGVLKVGKLEVSLSSVLSELDKSHSMKIHDLL